MKDAAKYGAIAILAGTMGYLAYIACMTTLAKNNEPPTEKRTCEIWGESPIRNVPAKCLNFWMKSTDERPQEIYIDPEELKTKPAT